MKLTAENYHSIEANIAYMSVSQYKDFNGALGFQGCEFCAMEKLHGRWEDEKTTALLQGSYVDAYFEGTLDMFKVRNPEIFTQKGELKAPYKRAEQVIERIERDAYFMKFLGGYKQEIMTAELFGCEWKIKIDSYFPDKMIVDLKVIESITKPKWTRDYGYLDFASYWGYDIQGAIYQKVVEKNTGKRLPFYLAVASKENEPDIRIFQIPQTNLDQAADFVEKNMPRTLAVKNGEDNPDKCDSCDCCKNKRVLTRPMSINDLLLDI